MLAIRLVRISLALGLCPLLSAAQGSDPFFRHVVGDVISTQITPDGSRAVFLADLQLDERFELFSAPTDGSAAPVRLNHALVFGGDVEDRYAISPDGAHVAFFADGDIDHVTELWCAPTDGSSAAHMVSGGATLDFVISFKFTPAGDALVFEGRTATDRDELWCAELDGTNPRRVNGTMGPGGNPLDNYLVTLDSARVLYIADASTDGVAELYSAPLDGAGPVVKLNDTLVTDGNVFDYALTPDGARVVYRADQNTNNVFELFSVPVDGSATAIRISALAAPFVDIEAGYKIIADGSVLYRTDRDENGCFELFGVPADGSAAPVRLSAALSAGESIEDFAVAGGDVVYRADQDTDGVIELYSVPLDGSQTTVKLSGTMQGAGDVQVAYALSPDGTRVVYRADQDSDEVFELYGAPVDGSSAAVKLNPSPVANRDVERGTPIDPSGTSVVFTVDADGQGNALYSAPVDGSAAALRLSSVGVAFNPSDTGAKEFAAGGRVLYRGVLDPTDPDFIAELFSVPLTASSAPLVLHPPLALGELDGDILDYEPTNDGNSVVYLARENLSRGLYIAHIDDPDSAARLTGNDILQQGFTLGPDSQRAAYCIFDVPHSNNELFSIALDGSTAPVRLSGTMVSAANVRQGFAFTPDSQYVVYLADAEERDRLELYSARADGSGMQLKLSGTLVANGDVASFRVAPDSAHVVYLADQDLDSRPELYSAPVDGSSAPVKLNGTLPLSTQVRDDYLVSPDGTHVFYRADEILQNAFELRVAPIDGSSAAIVLNGALPSGGSVLDYQVSLSGGLVVYRARQDVNFRFDLYAVPADGSAAPIKLDQTLVNGGNVGNYAITSDGAHVVYDADAVADSRFEVFCVPSDASAAPVRLHPPLGANSGASLRTLTPDGTRALYDLSTVFGGPRDVFTTPLDGSSAPVRLNEPLVQGREVSVIQVSPDSSTVVYASDEEQADKSDLYRVPSDGSAQREKISIFMVPGGNVGSIRISQDSSHVFFIADRDVDEVYELFQFTLGGGLLRLGTGGGGGRLATRVHPPLVDPRDHKGSNAPGRSVDRPAGF